MTGFQIPAKEIFFDLVPYGQILQYYDLSSFVLESHVLRSS